MIEETGAVEAAEPVAEAEVSAPEPKAEPKGERSSRAALDRAFDKIEAEGVTEAEPEAKEEKTEAESGQPRGPDGKFAPKQADAKQPEAEAPVEAVTPVEPPAPDVPTRFTAEAKAAWATTPDPVRAEIARAFREMEGGLQGYRDTVEPLKPFIEQAERNGQSLASVLQAYTGVENMLRQNPIAGLEQVCTNLGTTLRDVAAHVMGQPAPEKDSVIEGLRRELVQIKQQVGNVTTTIAEQTFAEQRHREKQTVDMVADFATKNTRFDDLSGEIAQMLKTGYASDLQDAYDKADRLNPLPQTPAVAPSTPPAPQTRKAGLSIQGAPGSDPISRQRSRSTGDALDRAFSKLGIA